MLRLARCHRTLQLATTLVAVATLLVTGRGTADAAVPVTAAEEIRRVLTLLTVVGEEYRESFDPTGELQRPLEYEEARSFLSEARQRWDGLGGIDGDAAVAPSLAELAQAIEGKAPVESVLTRVAALRAQMTATTGVGEEIYPSEPPSPQRGAAIFREQCASCHGDRGDGHGPGATRLERKPANFTDSAFMRGETPFDFFHVITVGKRGAAMPAWGDVLTRQERWDVVSHVWGLAHDAGQLAEGQGIYLSQCASCHGASGDGAGAYAAGLMTPVPDFTRPTQLAQRTDAELFATVRDGLRGTAMPAFRSMTDDERWKAVAFVRALSLGGPGGHSGDSAGGGTVSGERSGQGAAGTDALQNTRRLLAAALTAYRANDPQALYVVSDAYFQFEPLEQRLAVSAPSLTRSVEARFLELRGLMSQPGATHEAEAVVAAIATDLDAVKSALEPRANPYTLFVQSATVILREGFEVVLIIGALLAYVTKSGNAHMRRPILMGTATGVGLSLVTAYALLQLLRGTTAGAAEVLEGGTMLLAAVVLFWVSYWLVSKAEADKWQRFIQGKVKTAVTTGSGLALASAAFLAVYREGVETVLFYEALFGSAPGAASTVGAGIVTGSVALAAVYVLFTRFGMRIPIRQFFLGTSVLLYYMAIVFAGKGVAELQEAGWIGLTPVAGAPHVDVLGIYPTVQTLVAQGILVGLLVYAVMVTLRRRWRPPAERPGDVLGEVRALRTATDGLRVEIEKTRESGSGPGLSVLSDRLQGLVVRVEELVGQQRLTGATHARPNGGARRDGR